MLSACVVYEVDSGIDTQNLHKKITSGFSHHEDPSHIDEKLLTDVANVAKTEQGVEFVLRYDREDTRPVREKDDPWYKALRKVNVRVSDQYIILNGFHSRNQAAGELATVLDLDNDQYELVEFDSSTLTALVAEDAKELSQGAWDEPTENADSATIWGNIKDSSLYAEWNSEGQPTWARFESSSSVGKEVGLSTNKNSVVFGSGWELSEMEDYIFKRVIPNLPASP